MKRKKLIVVKSFFSILFAAFFIILTKVKLTPILGTKMKFSASVIFGPILSSILGIVPGTFSIVFAHLVGLLIGFYKIKSLSSYFIFLPIITAGIYFARVFKRDRKMVIPCILAILLFVLHPIGRKVWFYSLFWTIPIFIATYKKKHDILFKHKFLVLYAYSLGAAFVDHAVGSVMYLYFLNIPAKFWIQAIPLTIVERLLIAFGIMVSYLSITACLKSIAELAIPTALIIKEKRKIKVGIHERGR